MVMVKDFFNFLSSSCRLFVTKTAFFEFFEE